MKKILWLFLPLVLAGCYYKPLTHEQVRAVTEACHAAGMEYRARHNDIQCWSEQ